MFHANAPMSKKSECKVTTFCSITEIFPQVFSLYATGLTPHSSPTPHNPACNRETDFLQLEEDEHGTVTTSLAILPNKGKDLVVCMITTIKMPQPDSELFVYKVKRNIETDTDEWTPLDTKKIITLPSTTEKGERVPMVEYMEIKLIPQNNGYHSLEISTDNTDGQDDVKKPAVSIFKWNGTKFTLQK